MKSTHRIEAVAAEKVMTLDELDQFVQDARRLLDPTFAGPAPIAAKVTMGGKLRSVAIEAS